MAEDGTTVGPTDSQSYVSHIEQLLHELYQNPSPSAKSAAQRSLIAIQQSPGGWNITWHLLDHQSRDVQYFGASMLYQKISQFWGQLHPQHHQQLRLKIFQALVKFSNGEKIVRTRLCLALAVFVLHTTPQEWPNSVNSIIQTLSSHGNSSVLLEVLTVLPEEFESNPIAHIPARRGIIRHELKDSVSSVLAVLDRVFKSNEGKDVKLAAIKCFNSWTQFGLPITEILGIILFLLTGLEDPDLYDMATEALVEVAIHPDSDKYPEHMLQIMNKILQLRPLIQSKLDESIEAGRGICKVVVEFATANRSFLSNIACSLDGDDIQLDGIKSGVEAQQTDALDVMQLVLEFTSLPGFYIVNEECSEITLKFWMDFLETMETLSGENRKVTVDFYHSILTGLIEALTQKVMFPSEETYDSLTEDDRTNYEVYREDINDIAVLLQSFAHIEFLDYMSKSLASALNNPSPLWQQIEGPIYLLQSASQSLTSNSYPYLQAVFSQFSQFPSNSTLSKSLFMLLGSLGGWLNQQPNFLSHVLPLILGALRDPLLAPNAAISFKDICDECSSQLVPLSGELVSVFENTMDVLNTTESLRIIAALGKVLSLQPPAEIHRLLHSLTCSLADRLKRLASIEFDQKNKQAVDKSIQTVGALCSYIAPHSLKDQQHPLLPFVSEVWPSLKTLLVKWAKDQDIINSTCICLVRAIRSCDIQYSLLLGDTVDVFTQYLAAVRHPRVVDVATQIVVTFGGIPSQEKLMTTLIHRMHSLCMELYSDGTLKENPDTLQSFLSLYMRIITFCPQHIFSKDGAVVAVYELAAEALQAAESHTVSIASSLLVSYISNSGSYAIIAEVIMKLGKQLLLRILQGIAGGSPGSHIEPFADVIFALTKFCKKPLSLWLQEILSQDGFPTNKVTNLEKSNFIQSVLREEHHKRILISRIKEFSYNCKGYHGILT